MALRSTETAAPSEGWVRGRVVEQLVTGSAGGTDPVLVVQELALGRGSARADVVVIGADELLGVEIKAAADTLTRLARQAEWYGRVCNRCVLAADPAHVDGAAGLLPTWWGLTAVDRDGVREVRPAGLNPAVDPETVAHLLWMPELKAAVAEAGQAGGTAGLERADVANVLARAAGERTGAIVRQLLLQRRWVDQAEPTGQVRVVRAVTPSKKVAKRSRVRSKHERRALRQR